MSINSQGIIVAPVGQPEVSQTLSEPVDVGSCCVSDNINPFALFKPVDSDKINPTGESSWHIGKNEDFNLVIEGVNYGTPPKITYRKITTNYSLPFFNGYKHTGCALGFLRAETEITEGETVSISDIYDANLIMAWDILKYHKTFKNGKLKIMISYQEEKPCNHVESLNSTYVLADVYVQIPASRAQIFINVPSTKGAGEYTCYMTIDTGSSSNPQYFNIFVRGIDGCNFSHKIICKIQNQRVYIYDSGTNSVPDGQGSFYDIINRVWQTGRYYSPTSHNPMQFIAGGANIRSNDGFLITNLQVSDLTQISGYYVAVWEWNADSPTVSYNYNRRAYVKMWAFDTNSWAFTKEWDSSQGYSLTRSSTTVIGVPWQALPYFSTLTRVHFYIGYIRNAEPSVVHRASPIWAFNMIQNSESNGQSHGLVIQTI